jgi:hypothetical protein
VAISTPKHFVASVGKMDLRGHNSARPSFPLFACFSRPTRPPCPRRRAPKIIRAQVLSAEILQIKSLPPCVRTPGLVCIQGVVNAPFIVECIINHSSFLNHSGGMNDSEDPE